MRQNIEIKAKLTDPHMCRRRVLDAGASKQGVLDQTDTYFHVSTGRLKLRELAGRAELIGYRRIDSPSARESNYQILPVEDAGVTKASLAATLGIRVVVRKSRELFLWKNVRIHIDTVESLGNFVELEAVVGPDSGPDQSRRNLDELMQLLEIRETDLLAQSYVDLIEQASAPS